ncbi:MAG TPA: DNA-protecting protein DprA [Flavobacteriales bacterium]|mgnify:CR=1 FL=1|nr:DNA-protecting protein DprA [Flavobacteriales bacterium]
MDSETSLDQLKYWLALLSLDAVGPVLARKVARTIESPSALYGESRKEQLEKLKFLGTRAVSLLSAAPDWKWVEQELNFIDNNEVRWVTINDQAYPNRLKHCEDAPPVLFYKGEINFNPDRVLAIVGTRKATRYGKDICREVVAGFEGTDTLILSGLAQGIDIAAHRAAMEFGLQTAGVLGHGLDHMYPAGHRPDALKMERKGGIITEFPSGTIPDPVNFPRRNRIVAGMCDVLLVVESGKKGGSMITAELALSYNRDVFAMPGRATDVLSEGCNYLIKTQRAGLAQSSRDIIYQMNWELKKPAIQQKIFVELTDQEKEILALFDRQEKWLLDDMVEAAGQNSSELSFLLLNLELNGLLRALPGKVYSRT